MDRILRIQVRGPDFSDSLLLHGQPLQSIGTRKLYSAVWKKIFLGE